MYKDGGFDEDGACRVCISAASRRLFTSGCWLPWQPCRQDNATDATCGPVMTAPSTLPPTPPNVGIQLVAAIYMYIARHQIV